MPTDDASIEALKNIIDEIETLIATTAQMPEGRSERCIELLRAAQALAADITARLDKPTRA